MKLKTLPRIIQVNDYHILKSLPDDIKSFLGIKIKCKELGFFDGYIGLVYQGILPSAIKVKKLLENEGISNKDNVWNINT